MGDINFDTKAIPSTSREFKLTPVQKKAIFEGAIAASTGFISTIMAFGSLFALKAGIALCVTGVGIPAGICMFGLSVGLGAGAFFVGGISLYSMKKTFDILQAG